jgi:uncharacterized hydrophobic protein (TIGR00271 family)
MVQVDRGRGEDIVDLANKYSGANISLIESISQGKPADLVLASIPNAKVEGFVSDLGDIPDTYVTFVPKGVITLGPPPEEVPRQVTQVEHLSPIEVFLSGLQSVGSWTSFLGYSLAAGVIVWTGLFTNTIYLLIAAMLIAPFAGPAMNAAIASARGDMSLLGRSILRYVVSLSVTVAACAFLTWIMGQQIATNQMIDTSKISIVYTLLPLAAGGAGAFNLVQSDRNSLVSGTATGLLVSVSMAPPAGLIGMSAVIGRWDLMLSGLFLLATTIIAINLSGSLVFRAYGIKPGKARYSRGNWWVFPAALAVTALCLIGLVSLQLWASPGLERSTKEQQVSDDINQIVKDSNLGNVVESNVRFTRPDIQGRATLLANVYVMEDPGVPGEVGTIKERLTRSVQERLVEKYPNITPLVDVTVLKRPVMS